MIILNSTYCLLLLKLLSCTVNGMFLSTLRLIEIGLTNSIGLNNIDWISRKSMIDCMKRILAILHLPRVVNLLPIFFPLSLFFCCHGNYKPPLSRPLLLQEVYEWTINHSWLFIVNRQALHSHLMCPLHHLHPFINKQIASLLESISIWVCYYYEHLLFSQKITQTFRKQSYFSL